MAAVSESSPGIVTRTESSTRGFFLWILQRGGNRREFRVQIQNKLVPPFLRGGGKDGFKIAERFHRAELAAVRRLGGNNAAHGEAAAADFDARHGLARAVCLTHGGPKSREAV